MADYDPFARGPHPVGVATFELDHPEGDRTVPVEVWYPATAAHAGQDLDPATPDSYRLAPGLSGTRQEAVRDARPGADALPPIVFSHGFAGHRRQSTHLCCHLASHGYAVAAPDHVGNTTAEVLAWRMGGSPPDDMAAYIRQTAAHRTRDARRTLDGLLAGDFGVRVADDGAGMAGHSFGGWTTLQTTAEDDRILVALPLAPAGGRYELAGPDDPRLTMGELLELEWGRDVPTLMIVADDDTVLPLEGMHDLLDRIGSADRMVVLVDADHYHFCDGVEMVHDLMTAAAGTGARRSSELIPGAHAHQVTNGLGLAHFDAELRGIPEAAELLRRPLEELLAERGVDVRVVTG